MTQLVKPMTAPRMAVRTAITLLVFVVIFTSLLSAVYTWTLPTLTAVAVAEKMKLIDEVLPRQIYDNDPLQDTVRIAPSKELGLETESTVYQARKDGKISALVLEAVAPDGYAGKIRLLIAIAADGALIGVRVTQHKETPGLGDYIEPKKDKNKVRPWIAQLNNLNPALIDERSWKVKKDGGRFDSVAGATVTPRAVLKAVRQAALYVAENRERLFAPKQAEVKR
jgi:Na+-translocating ferredoxin:NAD+ oxidoreductase subunit G